ncbi:MAG: transcriptional regulator [Tepidiforma sp.]|nr:MAG: transcriptional regulator [Tepidiforma sp.]
MSRQVIDSSRAPGERTPVPASSPVRAAPQFGTLLREWRRRRRYSQLELALAAGVSQRHLSHLERGLARPGAHIILRLAEALDAPLAVRDALLTAAGFAPASPSARLGPGAARLIDRALDLVVRASEPFPAVVVDLAWNVRHANRPFQALISTLLPKAPTPEAGPLNLFRACFDPAGLRPAIENWDEVARALWERASREAAATGHPGLASLLDDIAPRGWLPPASPAGPAPLLPILPVVLAAGPAKLSFITVVSTFGTPQDALAEQLRVETFYPADAATEEALRRLTAAPFP